MTNNINPIEVHVFLGILDNLMVLGVPPNLIV